MTTNGGRIRRLLVAALAAGLTQGGLALPVAGVVPPTSSSLIEAYDNSTTDWFVASGPATFTSVTSPKSQGTAAMKVDYDFNAGSQVSLAPKRSTSAIELPGLPRRVSVDIHGDASWNVLYFQLRDSTGEIFHYWVGNISFTGWQTMSIEPGRTAPATTLSGNGDAACLRGPHPQRRALGC